MQKFHFNRNISTFPSNDSKTKEQIKKNVSIGFCEDCVGIFFNKQNSVNITL